MSEHQRHKRFLLLLSLLGLTRFINLGFEDLQAWDEALYAMRAVGIERFGGWIDQTAFAVDGLYSSLHPPLYVWLTAIVLESFGTSEFTLRFVSALAGAFTLPVIYETGRLLQDERTGWYAALLFGLNPFVSFFSRQGQFDTLMVLFISLSMLFILLYHQSNRRSVYLLLAGLSVAASLMSKLFVGGGVLIAYLVWVLFNPQEDRRTRLRELLLLSAIASLSLSWLIYMTIVHGHGDPLFVVKQSALIERAVTGIEGNVKPTEILYFLNQLVVLFPLGVSFFVAGLYRKVTQKDNRWALLAVVFLTFFIIFSMIRTKLAVYLLPMLAPASLFAAGELRRLRANTRMQNILILSGTAVALLWSASQDWRNNVKDVLTSLMHLALPPASDVTGIVLLGTSCILASLVLILLLRRSIATSFLRFVPVFIFVPALLWYGLNILYFDTVRYNDGAASLREFVDRTQHKRIVVTGFERNPQLTYYLDGADIGWRDDLSVRRIFPPFDRSSLRSWLHDEVAAEQDRVLLVIEKDKLIRHEIIDPLPFVPPGFERVFESRRYTCFQREPEVLLAKDKTNSSVLEKSVIADRSPALSYPK